MPVMLSPIRIDDRTIRLHEHVIELTKEQVPNKVDRLHVGDFEFAAEDEGRYTLYIIEHKDMQDFVASYSDGRLARFVQETGDACTPKGLRRAVLLEGDQFDMPTHGREWTFPQFDEALGSLQDLGVRVLRCPEGGLAARLAAWWRAARHSEESSLLKTQLPQLGPTYKDADGAINLYSPDLRAATRALMAVCPMVGEKKAHAILKEYTPGEALAYFTQGEYNKFKHIPGIGKGLVAAAQELLNRRVEP